MWAGSGFSGARGRTGAYPVCASAMDHRLKHLLVQPSPTILETSIGYKYTSPNGAAAIGFGKSCTSALKIHVSTLSDDDVCTT